jgi:hypothetical protein
MSKGRFVSKAEIAERLQVHPSSVKRILAQDGGLTPVKVGCRERYWESDVGGYYKKKGIV